MSKRKLGRYALLYLALSPLTSFGSDPTPPPSSIAVENGIVKLIREVDVASEVAGVLSSVMVVEGQQVQVGADLAHINDHKIQQEWKQARIDLERAKLEYANQFALQDAELAAAVAENELRRALDANRRNADTYQAAEVDRLKLTSDRSRLQVEQAKYESKQRRLDLLMAETKVETVKQMLDQYRVKAPWTGIVVTVDATPGGWVEPGTRIARIVDPLKLRVEGFVSSEYDVETLLGCKAEIHFQPVSGEPLAFTGTVVFVSSDVNPVNLTARIFIEVENKDGRLRPGWKVEASLLLDEQK